MSRECTDQILEMVEEGLLDAKDVLLAALKYMGEDGVRAMCHANKIDWELTEADEGEWE